MTTILSEYSGRNLIIFYIGSNGVVYPNNGTTYIESNGSLEFLLKVKNENKAI